MSNSCAQIILHTPSVICYSLAATGQEVADCNVQLKGGFASVQKLTAAAAVTGFGISLSSLTFTALAYFEDFVVRAITNEAFTELNASLVCSAAPILLTIAKICAVLAVIALVIWLVETAVRALIERDCAQSFNI